MEIDDAGVKVEEIRRFENGNGKAKIDRMKSRSA